MGNRNLLLGGIAALLTITLTSVACGRAGANPLSDTERAMAKLDAGRIDLSLAAKAAGGAHARPVGFRMQGTFAIEDGAKYPTLDMRYTSFLGDEERVTQIVSDGQAVHVIHDGARTTVPPAQARFLRIGKTGRGFSDLGFAGWVENPAVVERPDDTRTVTGTVDVADLFSDLARISGQIAGLDVDKLDGEGGRRLQRLVRHSEFTAELDPAGLPRNMRALVDFGRDVPAELRSALGPYASPRLEVTLSVEPAEH
ncbi:MAG TPA: hypothetical protein VJS45_04010 [Acidimicrobiia bacterium]|nr:hypothetical protein [Acidimicrobiia bacterium]